MQERFFPRYKQEIKVQETAFRFLFRQETRTFTRQILIR